MISQLADFISDTVHLGDDLSPCSNLQLRVTHKYWRTAVETTSSETNFRDSSTSANRAGSGRLPGVSNVVLRSTGQCIC